MYVSKKLGVSFTAIEIINGRWTMDKFDLRKDPATVKLFNVLPNTSALGLLTSPFSTVRFKTNYWQATSLPYCKKGRK